MIRTPARADVSALRMLYGSPQPIRAAAALALLAIRPRGRAVEVEVEAPGRAPERLEVADAHDPRLAGLGTADRMRVGAALAEARR